MHYWIEWKTIEGNWIREEIFAHDFEEAEDRAAEIAGLFGTGEHRTEIFGHSKKQSQ